MAKTKEKVKKGKLTEVEALGRVSTDSKTYKWLKNRIAAKS